MDCFPKFVDPADNFLCCLPLGVGAKAKICVISLAFLFKQSKHIFDDICIQDVYTVYTSSDSPSNLKGVASVAVCCSHCHVSLTAPDVAALGSGAVHSSNGALVALFPIVQGHHEQQDYKEHKDLNSARGFEDCS